MRYVYAFFCAVLLLFPVHGASVSADDPARVLQRAQLFYKASKFDSTIAIIRPFLRLHGEDRSSQELVPLLMESLVRKGDFTFTIRLFQIYIKRFPTSPFLPRLWYLEGIALVKDKEYDNGFLAFSNALSGGVSAAIDSLIRYGVQRICDKSLTGDECSKLAARIDLHPHIEEIVRYYDLFKLSQSGRMTGARLKAGEFIKKYPHSLFVFSVKDILEKSEKTPKGTVEIGVLAPLSGPDADIGKQIAQGIQLAVDRSVPLSDYKIRVVMCDTRSNMLETARKVQELVYEHHISVIIGPVLSQNAIVAASTLVGKDIVMITPTATDDGIATLGTNIFQMNVPLGILGARIAKYAMENCMIRDFVIFSPANGYGAALSRGFRDEVEKRGAEIVDEQTYEDGTKDFREQFEKLRQKLNVRKQQKTALEKSLTGESIVEMKYRKSDSKNDKRYVPPEDTTLQVGGLFIPAEYEDAVMIASQLLFYRIHSQLLGSTGWYNPKTIADGKEYVNNTLISNNVQTTNENDKEWMEFKTFYKTRYNSDPDRIAALGYDAATLALSAIKNKGGDRATAQQIAQDLSLVKNYKGASGQISFDPTGRVNTEATIMKIKDKQFIRVQ
jgi:ABC-type branched-subunit amino acid transport system substrate-binding protein